MVTWSQLIQPQASIDPRTFFADGRAFALEDAARPRRNDAWWMAKFAHLIYADDATIGSCLATIGMKPLAVDVPRGHDTLGTQFLVAAGGGDGPRGTVLAFRGTQPTELVDPTLDAIARRHRPDPATPATWLHGGFHLAHDAVALQVAATLRGAAEPLWITGHSLGGALAAIAASGRPAARVYTFGQPHVGSRDYVAPLDRPVFARVEHRCDIVPRVVGLLKSYRKAGARRYLTGAGEVRHDEDFDSCPTGSAAELLVDFLTMSTLVPQLLLQQMLEDPLGFTRRLAGQPGRLVKLAGALAALHAQGAPDGEELSEWGNALLDLARRARGIELSQFAQRVREIVAAGRGLPGVDGGVQSPALADHAIEQYVAKIAASDPAGW